MNNSKKAKVAAKIGAELSESMLTPEVMGVYYREVHLKKQPKPAGRQNYIGLEIECYSPNTRNKTLELVLAHDLENYVNVFDDGSIEVPYRSADYLYSCELRILMPEKEMPAILEKLSIFLKEGKFRANYSCGLHVHLDMRNRDVDTCYNKLLKFQDVLFGMVRTHRWDNKYCQWSSAEYRGQRFSAINRTAYAKHKTLEVRLHHGSVDMTKVKNWINLLLKAINSKAMLAVESKADVLKWAENDKKLRAYLSKGFNKKWFSRKSNVIKNAHQDDDEREIW